MEAEEEAQAYEDKFQGVLVAVDLPQELTNKVRPGVGAEHQGT